MSKSSLKMKLTGKVKFFDSKKDFRFILPDQRGEVILKVSAHLLRVTQLSTMLKLTVVKPARNLLWASLAQMVHMQWVSRDQRCIKYLNVHFDIMVQILTIFCELTSTGSISWLVVWWYDKMVNNYYCAADICDKTSAVCSLT